MIIIFYNLRNEMMRRGITQKDIAELLGITKQAVNYKIHGVNEFKLSEIDLIKDNYFNDLNVEYLFKREV